MKSSHTLIAALRAKIAWLEAVRAAYPDTATANATARIARETRKLRRLISRERRAV